MYLKVRKICCMALIISQPDLLKPHAYFNFDDAPVVSLYPAGPVKQPGLVRNGAGNGNRTRLSGLEGRRTSRCTTPAGMGHSENTPRIKNSKERGAFSFVSYKYIIPYFFKKINLFANKPTTIFFIGFITVRKREISPLPIVPSFDETLPILLERNADCFIVAN